MIENNTKNEFIKNTLVIVFVIFALIMIIKIESYMLTGEIITTSDIIEPLIFVIFHSEEFEVNEYINYFDCKSASTTILSDGSLMIEEINSTCREVTHDTQKYYYIFGEKIYEGKIKILNDTELGDKD